MQWEYGNSSGGAGGQVSAGVGGGSDDDRLATIECNM